MQLFVAILSIVVMVVTSIMLLAAIFSKDLWKSPSGRDTILVFTVYLALVLALSIGGLVLVVNSNKAPETPVYEKSEDPIEDEFEFIPPDLSEDEIESEPEISVEESHEEPSEPPQEVIAKEVTEDPEKSGFFFYSHYYKYGKLYTMPMSEKYQRYLYSMSEKYGVSYELMLAITGVESSFNPEVGTKINKNSGVAYYGAGMVNIEYETPRAEKLGFTLCTPKGGLEAVCEVMARKISEFENEYFATMAYNMGSGHTKTLISEEKTRTAYADKVFEIRKGLLKWKHEDSCKLNLD